MFDLVVFSITVTGSLADGDTLIYPNELRHDQAIEQTDVSFAPQSRAKKGEKINKNALSRFGHREGASLGLITGLAIEPPFLYRR